MPVCTYCGQWGGFHYSSCHRPPKDDLRIVPYKPQEGNNGQ